MSDANGSNGSGGHPKPPPKLSDAEIAARLSMQYRVPTVDLDEYQIEAAIIALVPRDLCERLRVIPVSRQGNALIVAMVDPTDAVAIEGLTTHTGMSVERLVVTEAVIFAAIERYYGPKG